MYYNYRGEKIVRQNVNLNSFLDVGLAGITYPNPSYRIMHNISSQFLYDYYVFEYVISGKGYIETETDKITVQAGDLYFLNKLHRHIYYADAVEPFEKIFITVKGRFLDSLVKAYKIKDSVIVKKCDVLNFMTDLLDMVDAEKSIPYDDFAIKILQLLQFLCNPISINETFTENFAEIIKNYLDSNLTNKITLDNICQDCHVSKSHVERIFTEAYEISPLKYFARAKAHHAASLLRSTNYSLSEIAEFLSYSDVKYMSRCFKQWMGESPLSYRKNKGELYLSKDDN